MSYTGHNAIEGLSFDCQIFEIESNFFKLCVYNIYSCSAENISEMNLMKDDLIAADTVSEQLVKYVKADKKLSGR